MAAFHEVAVVPTGGAGHAHGEVDGAKYREHRIWKVGRSYAAFKVVEHGSMVCQTCRPTTESGGACPDLQTVPRDPPLLTPILGVSAHSGLERFAFPDTPTTRRTQPLLCGRHPAAG